LSKFLNVSGCRQGVHGILETLILGVLVDFERPIGLALDALDIKVAVHADVSLAVENPRVDQIGAKDEDLSDAQTDHKGLDGLGGRRKGGREALSGVRPHD
jgi:hypothetical protein